MVNGPLIRPYFLWGGCGVGAVPLGSHEKRLPGFPSMLWDLPPTMGGEAGGWGREAGSPRPRRTTKNRVMSDEKRAPGC